MAQKTVAKQVKKESKDDSKRISKEVKQDELWRNISNERPVSFFQNLLCGKNVWYEHAGREQGEKIRENAISVGSNLVTRVLEDAEVFLVRPTAPQTKASWHAVLRGGVLVSEDIFDGACQSGFSVGFRRATEDPLLYHATQRFQEMNPKVFQCLTFHAEAITSKWKHVSLSQAKVVLCEAGEMKGLKKTGRALRQSSEFLKEPQLRCRDNSRSGRT